MIRELFSSGKCVRLQNTVWKSAAGRLGRERQRHGELCAFTGQCHGDYNVARLGRNSIAVNASSRLALAEVSVLHHTCARDAEERREATNESTLKF